MGLDILNEEPPFPVIALAHPLPGTQQNQTLLAERRIY
jgi:hypothetical protein